MRIMSAMQRVPERVMPNSAQPCGCYVRLPDYQAMMCAEHAARRDRRVIGERERREHQVSQRRGRMPWNGRGGGAFRAALVTGLCAVALAVGWIDAAAKEAAFADGYTTTQATVDAYTVGFARGSESYYDITFSVAGVPSDARLEDYDTPGPQPGDTLTIEYATSSPDIVRTAGYDSADEERVRSSSYPPIP